MLAEIYLYPRALPSVAYFSVVTSGDEKNGTLNILLLQPIWQGLIGGAILKGKIVWLHLKSPWDLQRL